MPTAMAVASLTPAAVCTGCYLTHRRRTEALTGVAMALMLLGMVDTMLLGGRLLPPVGWGALLATGAVVVQVDRWRRGTGTDPVLHLAAMGALLLVPALGAGGGHHHGGGGMGGGTGGGTAGGTAGWVLLAVLAVAAAHTGRAWLQLLRTPDTTTRVEIGTAATSVLAMAAMALL